MINIKPLPPKAAPARPQLAQRSKRQTVNYWRLAALSRCQQVEFGYCLQVCGYGFLFLGALQ